MRVLEPEDNDRFGVLAGMLPRPIIAPARTILLLLMHPRSGSGQ
jgi:hypothetical protein